MVRFPADGTESPRDRQLLERTLRDLEWGELLEGIAGRCTTSAGAAAVRDLRPLHGEAAARRQWAVSSDVLELSRLGTQLPPLNLPEVTAAIQRIARGGVGSGLELHQIRQGLQAVAELGRFVTQHGARAPALAEHLATEPSLRSLREELERCIEDGGAVLDRASAELARARQQVGVLRQRIKARLGELIGRYREALQDTFIAERDGRYVLPVRADAPFRVHGIVLGSSGSGATLYVEPQEIAELGNRLKVAEAEAEVEEARVLAQLSEAIAPSAPALLDALDACAKADALRAMELYARAVGARMLRWGAAGCVVLESARHPLLALQGISVVPNDLSLLGGRGLVLSGPNAGGKTVALKCLGLAALAQASGLPFPAGEDSSCGFFEAVFSDIGDDQSLARSLSTFSGHIETVRDIVERAGPGALVLFDELAGGTDPEEGAALAVALLEDLVTRRAAVAVTTHYERLKELGAESESIDNAAVGFDFDKLEPTFRLELGRPGASSALAVAQRHGLPTSILGRAATLLPEVSQRREKLLRELENKQVELEALRAQVEAEKERQAELARSLELERQRREERERRELSRAGEELSRTVREARAEVQRVLKGLSKQVRDRQELKQAERTIDEAARLVALGGELDRRTRTERVTLPSSVELAVGHRVRVHGMNTIAEVIEAPDRGQVRVLAGVMKLTVSVDQVELVEASSSQRPGRAERARASRFATDVQELATPPRTEDVTLDLRGERVEAGLSLLDEFIDTLLRRGENVGYVLHGHGSGAMKNAVRSHLRELGIIRLARPAERDEGGDAFTVFWLS